MFWSVVSKQSYGYTAQSRRTWKIPPAPPKRFSGEVAGHPWNLFCSFLFFSALFLPSLLSLFFLFFFFFFSSLLHPSLSFDSSRSVSSSSLCLFSCYALPFPYLVSMLLFSLITPPYADFELWDCGFSVATFFFLLSLR